MHFADIYINSFCIEENEFYSIYHDEETPYMYDHNFLLLHYQPTLEEFKIIEQNLLDFHEEAGLEHVKFIWPEGTGLTTPVASYLAENE